MHKKILMTLICALFTAAIPTQAAKKSNQEPVLSGAQYILESNPPMVLSEADFSKELAAAKLRKGREIASNLDYESQMSADLKKIREDILKLKEVNRIDTFLLNLKSRYRQLAPDAQLVAIQLDSIRLFKGILSRLMPLAQKNKVTTSVFFSSIYGLSSIQSMYWPTKQGELLMAYVSEPYDNISIFNEAEDLQLWLGDVVYPYMAESYKKLSEIPISQPLIWDNKIVLTQMVSDRMDTQDRYFLIGPAEKNALLMRMQVTMQNICEFRAFAVAGLMNMTKELGKLTGVDGWLGSAEGVSAMDRVEVINKFPNTFMRYQDGSIWTRRAFVHFGEAVKKARLVWEELRGKPANRDFILNPGLFNANERSFVESLPVLEGLAAGETPIKSNLTGEVIVVNLKAFYQNPPIDLKNLLPTEFDKSPARLTKKVQGFEEPISYVNPKHGHAIKWANSSYKSLFPQLSDSKNMEKHLRILSQSWGGSILSLPLDIVARQ